MYLCYINEIGENYRGDTRYEFIFTEDIDNVVGVGWEEHPAIDEAHPPNITYIDCVGVLEHKNIKFDVLQNSDSFSYMDSVNGIIAIGWENYETYYEYHTKYDRLVFKYGDKKEDIEKRLYSREIILKYE